MIRNSKICCCNGFSPNRYFLLKIINNGTLRIQAIIQYTLGLGTVTKTTGILNPNERTRLTFQPEATNVCFNIINESLPNRPLIFHDCLSTVQTTCYEVRGTAQNPTCINVPC